jgi:hypothetical protein
VNIRESTRSSLAFRLSSHARERWPDLGEVKVKSRANFAYVSAKDKDGTEMALCRLRYEGYASEWGFAIYLASKDGYEDSVLPSGQLAATPKEALDLRAGCTCRSPRLGLARFEVTAQATVGRAGCSVCPWAEIRAISSSRSSRVKRQSKGLATAL